MTDSVLKDKCSLKLSQTADVARLIDILKKGAPCFSTNHFIGYSFAS